MESLWMGVPVLTLQGDSLVGRQGVGILMNADLSNWIATDKNEYLTKVYFWCELCLVLFNKLRFKSTRTISRCI
jgi:hypothetical protein